MNEYKAFELFSRRRLLFVSAGVWSLSVTTGWSFAKTDFWNQKDPSQWTEAERDRILTNSPWARKATVTFERGKGDGLSEGGGAPMGGMGGGAMGGMGAGGRGGPPMGGDMGGGGGRGGPPMGGEGGGPGEGGMPKIEATVRWESAAPVRAALKDDAPAEIEAYYVIAVVGMSPMAMPGRGGMAPEMGAQAPNDDDMLTRFQQTSQIEVKGQPLLHPKKVTRKEGPGGQTILLYFEKSELPITAASKEVAFTAHMGPMVLKPKFIVKEMAYKEQIAL